MRFATIAFCSLALAVAAATPTVTAAQTPAPANAPVRVGGQVKPPERVKYVAPVYPDAAAAARVSGIVIIEATIGTDGSVTDAHVVRSIALLDQAALTAVKQWKYTPTTLNGRPVPLIMTVTVNFTPPAGSAAAAPAADAGQTTAPEPATRRDPDIDYTDANIKLTFALTDKGAATQTKTLSLIVANRSSGRIRAVQSGTPSQLGVDAMVTLRKSGYISASLTITYQPEAAQSERGRIEINESVQIMLKDGVPMVITQSTEPGAGNRSVSVEVTATILK